MLAHLEARATARDARARLRAKLALVKRLFGRAYSKQDVLELFRFLDWVLALPAELAHPFQVGVRRLAKERRMPYISSIERLAMERGLNKGRAEGRSEGRSEGRADAVLDVLAARFERVPRPVRQSVRRIKDDARLSRLLRRAATARSLDAFQAALRPSAPR